MSSTAATSSAEIGCDAIFSSRCAMLRRTGQRDDVQRPGKPPADRKLRRGQPRIGRDRLEALHQQEVAGELRLDIAREARGECRRRHSRRPGSRRQAARARPARRRRRRFPARGRRRAPPLPGCATIGEYSVCTAAIGCTACARRIVAADISDSPIAPILPASFARASAPTELLDRHPRVEPVQIIEVDMIGSEPPQRSVERRARSPPASRRACACRRSCRARTSTRA